MRFSFGFWFLSGSELYDSLLASPGSSFFGLMIVVPVLLTRPPPLTFFAFLHQIHSRTPPLLLLLPLYLITYVSRLTRLAFVNISGRLGSYTWSSPLILLHILGFNTMAPPFFPPAVKALTPPMSPFARHLKILARRPHPPHRAPV